MDISLYIPFTIFLPSVIFMAFSELRAVHIEYYQTIGPNPRQIFS